MTGFGKKYRSVYAGGLIVARYICTILRVIENDGAGAKRMGGENDAENVILINAVQPDTAPNTLHRIAANEQKLQRVFLMLPLGWLYRSYRNVESVKTVIA